MTSFFFVNTTNKVFGDVIALPMIVTYNKKKGEKAEVILKPPPKLENYINLFQIKKSTLQLLCRGRYTKKYFFE